MVLNLHGIRAVALGLLLLLSPAARVNAAPVVIYSNDFDGSESFAPGISGGLGGITTTTAVQGLPAPFAGNLLHNATGNIFGTYGADTTPTTPTTLTLTGLPAHTSISLSFVFAAIDSWDGLGVPGGPDRFNVTVDGVTVFSHVFTNDIGTSDYTAPLGVALGGLTQMGFNGQWLDRAFNFGLDSAFENIPHAATTLTVSFFASSQGASDGTGWQGGTDESWGIDNLEVIVVSEPLGTLAALPSILLLLLLWAWQRKDRTSK